MAVSSAEDWQVDSSVLESNKHMLEEQFFCDVTFNFTLSELTNESENTISAHKYMLVSRSPVFSAMFTGPAKDESREIRIDDIELDTFKEMLKFIYYEEADLTGYNVLAVLYSAKKYMVGRLEKLCRKYLEENINGTNAPFILEQAANMMEIELEEKCLEIIGESTSDAFSSESFTKISRSTLERILKRDTLNIEETEVYEACVRWATAECAKQDLEGNDENRRKVLGEVIFLVRFPVMKTEDVTNLVGRQNLLSAEEFRDLILHTNGYDPHKPLAFSTTKRSGTYSDAFFSSLQVKESNVVSGEEVIGLYMKETKMVWKFSHRFVLISAMHFTKHDNVEIKSIKLGPSQSSGFYKTQQKIEGFELWKAEFSPPVKIQSGRVTIRFECKSRLGYGTYSTTSIKGDAINNTKLKISRYSSGSWNFVVGFRYKEIES